AGPEGRRPRRGRLPPRRGDRRRVRHVRRRHRVPPGDPVAPADLEHRLRRRHGRESPRGRPRRRTLPPGRAARHGGGRRAALAGPGAQRPTPAVGRARGGRAGRRRRLQHLRRGGQPPAPRPSPPPRGDVRAQLGPRLHRRQRRARRGRRAPAPPAGGGVGRGRPARPPGAL
ncbi:MAG: hypothetical protein AVDCRST_MAG79-1296, partial [uncultured Thermoleophilia bacterium]